MTNFKIIGAIVALIFAILFFIGGVIILPVLYSTLETTDSAYDYKYGIVIDAGSSHTSLFFCRWNQTKDRGTGDVEQIHECEMELDSLSSFTDDPDNAGTVFDTCLEESYANDYIPEDQRETTQIFLGATAGMRLVNRTNESISEQIFVSVNKTLENSEYDLTSGRIITGQEEAVSGWIIVNYLETRLQNSNHSLIGALDLGGASTQITFPHSTTEHSEYESMVTLYGEEHVLYARSYLCYGQDQARLRFLAHLINSSVSYIDIEMNSTVEVDNPCLLKDARITYQEEEIFSSVCVKADTSSELFGYGYSRPRRSAPSDEAVNFTFVGTGNPDQCNETIYELFDLTRCSDPTVCIDSTYFWPPVNNSGMYLGMSAYYFNANFFNNSDIDLTDLTNYTNTVREFCAQSNETVYPTHSSDRFLQRYCFGGPYCLFLLQKGFGFNSSNTDWTLKFVRKVAGMSVDWALGYMINQTTTIPSDPHEVERPFSAVALGVGVAVLVVACVLCLIVFFILCCMGLRAQDST